MKRTAFIGFKMAILLLVLCFLFPDVSLGKTDPKLFSEIKPRGIGPANMSGRIGDIDVVIANPRNSAGVGRGIFKSIDAGGTRTPLTPPLFITAVNLFIAVRTGGKPGKAW